MDQNLEARLHALAEKGELVHATVHASWPVPNKPAIYKASYSPAKFGNGFGEHADPVIALCLAIDDWKPARKPREPRQLTEAELPDPAA